MQIYYPIEIDLNQIGLIPTVKAKQGDSGRGLIATLTNAGELVSAVNNSCRVYAKKPDGTIVYATCEVNSDGKVLVEFTTQMLAAVGTIQLELEMQQGTNLVTTPILNLVVMPTNIDDGAIPSTDEYTVLQGLIAQFTAQIGRAEQYANNAAESAEQAEEASQITDVANNRVFNTTWTIENGHLQMGLSEVR